MEQRLPLSQAKNSAKVIWYHNVQALGPAGKVCRNVDAGVVMSNYLLTLEHLMKDIWTEYEAKTMPPFGRDSELNSSKSTMELRLCVVAETHLMAEIGRTPKWWYISVNSKFNADHLQRPVPEPIMAEGGLTFFAYHGKTTSNSGGPAVLFISEYLQNDEVRFLRGGSKTKLRGYVQLEGAVDKGRVEETYQQWANWNSRKQNEESRDGNQDYEYRYVSYNRWTQNSKKWQLRNGKRGDHDAKLGRQNLSNTKKDSWGLGEAGQKAKIARNRQYQTVGPKESAKFRHRRHSKGPKKKGYLELIGSARKSARELTQPTTGTILKSEA